MFNLNHFKFKEFLKITCPCAVHVDVFLIHRNMFGNIILGAILGALGCLYFLAKKKSKKDGTQHLKGEILFLNILILDKTEAVQKGVADKYSYICYYAQRCT